jgi:hypothetical protein
VTLFAHRLSAIIAVAAMSTGLGIGPALAGPDPLKVCLDDALTYRQQYICKQDLANAQSKSDQKAVAKRFQDIIRDVKAQKEKEGK